LTLRPEAGTIVRFILGTVEVATSCEARRQRAARRFVMGAVLLVRADRVSE